MLAASHTSCTQEYRELIHNGKHILIICGPSNESVHTAKASRHAARHASADARTCITRRLYLAPAFSACLKMVEWQQ